jgi:hypothetical protein
MQTKASETSLNIAGLIREAKKAMMMGLKGKELATHIKDRFDPDTITASKDDLVKLSSEQGLLGNVYVDASAFNSAKEMEQFLANHRNRLASYIVVNGSHITADVLSLLASRFRKNVVATLNYNDEIFKKYKNHLTTSGRIGNDFVINSKETLKKAFCAVPEKNVYSAPVIEEKRATKEELSQALVMANEANQITKLSTELELSFRKTYPIVECAREMLSKGKTASGIKEVLRKKYAKDDLKESFNFLKMALTDGSTESALNNGEITEYIGEQLKKLAKKYPVRKATVEAPVTLERVIGVPGYLHVMNASNVYGQFDEQKQAAVNDLRKGMTPEQVKSNLLSLKLSNEQADTVLLDAVKHFNEVGAGVKANVYVKPPKQKVADLPEKVTLPDPSTIPDQINEIVGFFKGSNDILEIDPAPRANKPLEVGNFSSGMGLDGAL